MPPAVKEPVVVVTGGMAAACEWCEAGHMRYVVTGATGFIGGALARRLVSDGHEVVALVRRPEAGDALAESGVLIAAGEVTNKQDLRAALRDADGLFHVAGWYRVGDRHPDVGRSVNVEGTRAAMAAARELGTPRIVFTSTLSVNSSTRRVIPDESYRFRGRHLSVYDETKARAHDLVAAMSADGLPAITVMPGMVYGPGDTSQTGRIMQAVLAGHRPLAPGGLWLCVAHVDDIVDGHVQAMEHGRPGESYMLAGPAMRFADFLRLTARLAGQPGPRVVPARVLAAASSAVRLLDWAPMPARYRSESLRVSGASYLGNPAKAHRELGWTARQPEQGVADMLAERRKR